MDDHLVNANRQKWDEPPDMDMTIDTYFSKQEECKLLSMDSKTPITDAEMAQKLITHMGKTGLVSRPYMKFKKLSAANRTWTKGKDDFREALTDIEDTEKATVEEGLYANNATRQNKGTPIKQKDPRGNGDQAGRVF